MNIQTYIQTDRQTDRQTDKQNMLNKITEAAIQMRLPNKEKKIVRKIINTLTHLESLERAKNNRIT